MSESTKVTYKLYADSFVNRDGTPRETEASWLGPTASGSTLNELIANACKIAIDRSKDSSATGHRCTWLTDPSRFVVVREEERTVASKTLTRGVLNY